MMCLFPGTHCTITFPIHLIKAGDIDLQLPQLFKSIKHSCGLQRLVYFVIEQ